MEIISRLEAKQLGIKRYFTGKPCPKNHITERFSRNGGCCECSLQYGRSRYSTERKLMLSHAKKYRENNKEQLNQKSKEWRANNPDKQKECIDRYRSANKEVIREKGKIRRERDAEKLKQWNKIWSASNRDHINKKRRGRLRSNPEFKCAKTNRDIVRRILTYTGKKKAKKTEAALGYGAKELRAKIESMFLTGMTWENHGTWHIDHIKPIAAFIREGITDPAVISALSNLQPLWAKDNLAKSDKW